MGIAITRMTKADMSQIMKIQSENQRNHLTPFQQKNGFLSIAFSEDEFNEFNNNLCVAIAKERDEVIGFCCISSAKYNSQFPILDQITANLSSYSIPGTPDMPSEEKTCIYGPVCISLSHRGKGALKELFTYASGFAKKTGYLYCFSFISSENTRSLNAHTKLSFHPVSKVNYNNKEYEVIACKL